MAVADPKQKRTFATLFGRQKKRGPESPSKARVGQGWTDNDFDKMLLHRQKTKKLTLSRSEPPHAAIWQVEREDPPSGPVASPLRPVRSSSNDKVSKKDKSGNGNDPHIVEGKASFFSKREKIPRRVRTDAKVQKAREIDFELQSASGVSSPEHSSGDYVKNDEDKWMGEC